MKLSRDLTCAEVVELVTEYLEGGLRPDERERFEEHLGVCDLCATLPRADAGDHHAAPVGSARDDLGARGRGRADSAFPGLEDGVIAYKFLDHGRLAPFTGVRWPEPRSWLESDRVELCVSGVHACRVRDLPYWLRTELWEVELEGDVVEGERLVAARRGRLVRRIEGWNDASARAFGASCAEEARRRAAASRESRGTRPMPSRRQMRSPHLLRSRAPGSPSSKTGPAGMRPSACARRTGLRRGSASSDRRRAVRRRAPPDAARDRGRSRTRNS